MLHLELELKQLGMSKDCSAVLRLGVRSHFGTRWKPGNPAGIGEWLWKHFIRPTDAAQLSDGLTRALGNQMGLWVRLSRHAAIIAWDKYRGERARATQLVW